MHKNKSISIDDYFEDFIQSKISGGRYNNADKVVRAGLRLLEEAEIKVTALKAAIQEGIESGIVLDFNYESHLKNLIYEISLRRLADRNDKAGVRERGRRDRALRARSRLSHQHRDACHFD